MNSFHDDLDNVIKKIMDVPEEELKKIRDKWNTHIRDLRNKNRILFRNFAERNIGFRYVEKFSEDKVKNKKAVDTIISNLVGKKKGAVIMADVGVGKTMALLYIAKRVTEEEGERCIQKHYLELERVPVSYFFMPRLFALLHSGGMPRLEKYVLLDDWGREYAEPFVLSQFEALIEKIYASKRGLVITTNLLKEEFYNRPGWERIIDRVREMCSVLVLSGKSRRAIQ